MRTGVFQKRSPLRNLFSPRWGVCQSDADRDALLPPASLRSVGSREILRKNISTSWARNGEEQRRIS
jgi:hypothetical protein